jgi:hypothetical protein
VGCEAEYRMKHSTEVKDGDKLSMRDNFGRWDISWMRIKQDNRIDHEREGGQEVSTGLVLLLKQTRN